VGSGGLKSVQQLVRGKTDEGRKSSSNHDEGFERKSEKWELEILELWVERPCSKSPRGIMWVRKEYGGVGCGNSSAQYTRDKTLMKREGSIILDFTG